MPRPSRICSIIDCGRVHHAQGFCRRHYSQYVTKPNRSAKRRSEAPESDDYARLSVTNASGPLKVTFSDGTVRVIPLGDAS